MILERETGWRLGTAFTVTMCCRSYWKYDYEMYCHLHSFITEGQCRARQGSCFTSYPLPSLGASWRPESISKSTSISECSWLDIPSEVLYVQDVILYYVMLFYLVSKVLYTLCLVLSQTGHYRLHIPQKLARLSPCTIHIDRAMSMCFTLYHVQLCLTNEYTQVGEECPPGCKLLIFCF